MELIAYIRLFRKWFWLIFLGMFLAGGAAFLYRSRQPDQYQAKATILVGGFIQSPNPDYSEIMTGQDLAQTYAALARTVDVLDATVQAGDFPVTADQLVDPCKRTLSPKHRCSNCKSPTPIQFLPPIWLMNWLSNCCSTARAI